MLEAPFIDFGIFDFVTFFSWPSLDSSLIGAKGTNKVSCKLVVL